MATKFKLAAFADEADASLEKQIIALKENGIPYLEIRGVNGENILDLTNEKAKEAKKQLDDAAIAVWSIGSPSGKMSIEEEFSTHLDRFCHGLELAWILGAEHFRMFSFFTPRGKEPAAYRDVVMERIGLFAEKAKGSGILLCHENEKEIFGDIASRCVQIHEAFPQIRAIFDPANFVQCSQDTKEAWQMLSQYVEYMHVKDAKNDGAVVPAGMGDGNLSYLLSQYSGEVLTIEPHLSVFDGFAQLEGIEGKDMKTEIDNYRYPSNRVAFDAAVTALKSLI